MKYVYSCLFWLFTIITVYLTCKCVNTSNYQAIKDFSLPLLAIIFTIGQLLHNEKKQEFEEYKYIQSRRDLYFDKKVEIALSLNKYIPLLCSQLSLPFFKKELDFNHSEFYFNILDLYANVVDKARFLFDKDFINKIRNMVEIMEQMQHEIQIMQNHLIKSEQHRSSENFKIAENNFYELHKKLRAVIEQITYTCVEEINIRNDIQEKINKGDEYAKRN